MLVALVLVAVPPSGHEHLSLPAQQRRAAMLAAAAFTQRESFSHFWHWSATAAMIALMMNVEPITTLIAARFLCLKT